MNLIGKSQLLRTIRFELKKLFRQFGKQESLEFFDDTSATGADSIQHVLVINLDRQPKRWAAIIDEAQKQSIGNGRSLLDLLRRVPAVDGKNLDQNFEFKHVTKGYPLADQYFVDPDPRLLTIIRKQSVEIDMTVEERSVAESHVKAWQSIVQLGVQYALVLEDDVFFEREFSRQINATWKELVERQSDGYKFDILYLSFKEVERGATKRLISPNVLRLTRGVWWMSGYVLSYAGAEKLLSSLPVVGPVDLWVNHLFAKLDVFSTPRSVIFQRDDMTSDNKYSILPLITQIGIQTDKTLLELEQKKGNSPVFCIGYSPSSAERLSRTLSMLGYRCCNNNHGQFTKSIANSISQNRPLLFDAYIDNEILHDKLDYLITLHPGAIFLFCNSPGDSKTPLSDGMTKSALKYGHKGKLYRYDIAEQKGWKRLCSILACKVPVYQFPSEIPDKLTAKHFQIAFRDGVVTGSKGVVHEHDVHPWIVPHHRMEEFGVLPLPEHNGVHAACYLEIYQESFETFNDTVWHKTRESFPANLADFLDENIEIRDKSCNLWLRENLGGKRSYSAASFSARRPLKYGRVEIDLRAAKGDGIVTAFFLHRNDPWQEIDIEILGKDTTKILLNVYYNPGDPGTVINYGNRGTPIVFDLGFDASIAYHTYSIEWNPFEIIWYVDNLPIHRRTIWSPTPIPDLELKVFFSIWLPNSVELAGLVDKEVLPTMSQIRRFALSRWTWEPDQRPELAFIESSTL